MKKPLALPLRAVIAMIAFIGASPISADGLIGQWGGRHIRLAITREGGRMSLECGNGFFPLPAAISDLGAFSVKGRLDRYRPGPSSANPPDASIVVSVRGQVTGNRLRLFVSDESGTQSRFDLVRNDRQKLIRCL